MAKWAGAADIGSLHEDHGTTPVPLTPIEKHMMGTIEASDLFDADWYMRQYPDVGMIGMDPLEHYVRIGSALGRTPHSRFDAAWYSANHRDIKRGSDPLVHFLKWGRFEGRKTRGVGKRFPTLALCIDRKGGADHKIDVWDAERERHFLSSLAAFQSWQHHRPEVAVIMPTHNRAGLITSAIRSVLAQGYESWQLWIVDDGSTDETQAVITPFLADSRIHYIQQAQGGVAAARNAGLEASSGEYVFYLDTDNIWRQDFLGTMVSFMEIMELGAAYCGARVKDDHDGQFFRGDDFSWQECLRENYIDMNGFGHARSRVHASGPFDESLRRMVDWDFILRVTRDHGAAYAPFCGVDYYDGMVGNRISRTEYLDGSLPLFRAKIRAKHAGLVPASATVGKVPIAEEVFSSLRAKVRGAFRTDNHHPIRLGYVVWDWSPSAPYILKQARLLAERGVDVAVYCRQQADEAGGGLVGGAPIHHTPTLPMMLSQIRADRRQILHSTNSYPAAKVLAMPLAVELGLPFTFMASGPDISEPDNVRRHQVAEVVNNALCAGVITTGGHLHRRLTAQGVAASRIIGYPLPHDSPSERRSPHSAESASLVIVCTDWPGSVEWLDSLTSSVAVTSGRISFLLHGADGSTGWACSDLQAGQTGNSVVRGVFLDEGRQARAAPSLLVNLTRSPGPLAPAARLVLQAMALGIPVITTPFVGVEHLIEHGVSGWNVTPGDFDLAARSIHEALSLDAPRVETMAHRAREKLGTYESHHRIIDDLLHLWFSSLAGLPTVRAV